MNSNVTHGTVLDLGEAGFESGVLCAEGPVLVAFWAPWSEPCRILRPTLDAIAAACAGTVTVVRINADDAPELSLWYDVQSVPTLLYFVNGRVRHRLVGTASTSAILDRLKQAAEPATEPGLGGGPISADGQAPGHFQGHV